MEKVIRDGMVAVLYSPGFGAGWSTWAVDKEIAERCLFDPLVVAWVEGGKQGPVPVEHYGEYFYSGGASDLQIAWIQEGTLFRVEEYDGSESIHFAEDYKWVTA